MQKGWLRPCVLCTVFSSDSVSLCPLTRTTQKKNNQESMQSLNSNDQTWKCWAPGSLQNVFGLRAPQPNRIRAPVSKMVGLRAPQQKFQGSWAPGTPLWNPENLGKYKSKLGIAWHIDSSSVVWTLVDNGKLVNQIARLVAIVVK